MTRKLRKHGIGCVLSLFGIAAMAQGALITFDSPPAGLTVNNFIQGSAVVSTSEITNQFESLGVILSSATSNVIGELPAAPYAVLVNLTGQAPSGTNGIGAANSSNILDYTEDTDIFLVVPGTTTPAVTDSISIQGDEIPLPGTVTFTAYDINGNQIDSGSAPDTAGGTYALSIAGIHEFRIHSSSGTVAYDNLSFDTPAAPTSGGGSVPEPATFGLIGSGISALVLARSHAITRSRKLFAGQRTAQPGLREA
jgi:hypothetical protein